MARLTVLIATVSYLFGKIIFFYEIVLNLSSGASERDSSEAVGDDRIEGQCESKVRRNRLSDEPARQSSRSRTGSRCGRRKCDRFHSTQSLIDRLSLKARTH